MKLIRLAKIILAISIGIWGLVGLVGNLTGLMDVYGYVKSVTSMAGVPDGVGPPWATSNPIIVWLGVLAIVLGKVAGVICGWGGIQMVRHWKSPAADFNKAKQFAVAGCGLAFALNFAAFTVFAESVFFMFYAGDIAASGELAFRFFASFALAALFIAQNDPD